MKPKTIFFKKIILLSLAVLVFSLTGCGEPETTDANFSQMLVSDAVAGLKGEYAATYTRLTIIRGALNQYIMSPEKPQLLGIAVGALQATVFPDQYELQRFSKLENITPQIRTGIISQAMLAITMQNKDVLNHIYTAVLKPLSEQQVNGTPVSAQQLNTLNNLISHLDELTQGYLTLADKNTDFKSQKAEDTFLSMQNTYKELYKLQLVNQ